MKPRHHSIITGTLVLCFTLFNLSLTKAQIVIGQPNLQFTRACANDSFNSFETSFIFNPPSALSSSNQFIIELSDANGDFSESVEVYISNPGEITTSPATISFAIPLETAGDEYKIRIKSTAPEASSISSIAFPAYYKLHDTPFTINNLVDTGTFCPNIGYLFTIDNPGFDGNVSPLSYDNLNFNWYKAISNTSSELVGQGTTFLATEEGTYFAETDYGSCPSDSFSNRVTISQANDEEPADAVISSSLGTVFCSSGQGTILSTSIGDSYQWFRNDEPIANATGNTIEANVSGNYAVIINSGNCVAVGSIFLDITEGSAGLNVAPVSFIGDGEGLEIIVNTTFSDAVYEWYLNDELIASAQSDRFTATQIGKYKVIVNTTGDCDFQKELFFEIRARIDIDSIPNLISPNGDGQNDTWMIPAIYLSGTGTEIAIFNSFGEVALQTTDYMNNWPDDLRDFDKANQVFYYVIAPQDDEPIRGSISVIR